MDSEQAKYRELFQRLEKEATEAKTRRSSKIGNGIVSASCAAVLAVYVTGYARTQSAADRFTKELSVRRVAALPLPGVNVSLDRRDVSHPRVEVYSAPAPEPLPDAGAPKALHLKPAPPGPDPATVAEPRDETPSSPAAEPVKLPAPASVPPIAVAPLPQLESAADASKPEAVPAATPAHTPALVWKDGTYTGWGYSRHGNIEAQVIIESGRITSATISQCRTRYSCSVIDRLPPEVVDRQSPDVDYVSGATQSADAFYGAVVEALAKAK